MSTFAAVLSALFAGFLIGGAARFALPGPDPMPFWLTAAIGLTGSVVGGGIALAIYGKGNLTTSSHVFVTLLLEIGVAVALVAAYRRFVQRRPLTGPEAHRFPTRGVGIPQLRQRLHQLGIDPDKVRTPRGPVPPPGPQELTPEEISGELEKLRDLHDKGILTDEQYDEARERLRRY